MSAGGRLEEKREDPASLPHDQGTLLREAIAELPMLQKKMAFDFLGQSL